MKLPKIYWGRALRISVLILFMLPFISLVLPSGATPERQSRLNRIIDRIERLEQACDEPKLRGALRHTAYRYRKVGVLGIRTQPLCWGAGINIPWCPGFVIDPKAWDCSDETLLWLIVHEAHHDFYPWLGHYQYWGTIPCAGYTHTTEFDRLMRREP